MQMLKSDESSYDAIIIGAGISGLVCGCYLAKAGLKVLIAEQHFKPGGYCSTFKRKRFNFPAAAHSFGGYRNGGTTKKIFNDLKLTEKVKIVRSDPSTVIIAPEYKLSFWSDLNKTINDFQIAFPDETENISDFFHFLTDPQPMSFARIRSWTFGNLLDRYFANDKLKAILAAPLLGIGGIHPFHGSAFVGAKLFSEFLIDGGYLFDGGMQVLPDALASRFVEFGGEIRCSRLVKEITVKDNSVAGVVLEKDGFIKSKYVISGCDATQTFIKLIGRKHLTDTFYNKMTRMEPSMSDFVVYLGMDEHFNPELKPGPTLFFLRHYDLDKAYQAIQHCNFDAFSEYLVHISLDKSIVLGILPAPYKSKSYWLRNKEFFLNSFIDRVEKELVPNFSKHIIYKEAATPHTLHKYTLNSSGASYGWAAIPSQIGDFELRKPSFIKGLYLTGHWTTLGVGISGVIYVGQNTAELILRGENSGLP